MRRLVAVIIAGSCLTVRAHQQPLFRGATDLVAIDVVVRAEGGRFVEDLSADDFTLIDDGQPQTIQQLYLHTPDSPVTKSTPPGRIFILLFDNAHLSTTAAFMRSRAAAESLISKQFRPGDSGGILNQTSGDARLTSDREELLDRLRQLRPNSMGASRIAEARMWPRITESDAIAIGENANAVTLDAMVRRACAEDPAQCDVAADAVRTKAHQMSVESRSKTAGTVQLLTQALKGVAGLDGRKAVLFMSEGFRAEDNWPKRTSTMCWRIDRLCRRTVSFTRSRSSSSDTVSRRTLGPDT
jgi:VWFA-related protein